MCATYKATCAYNIHTHNLQPYHLKGSKWGLAIPVTGNKQGEQPCIEKSPACTQFKHIVLTKAWFQLQLVIGWSKNGTHNSKQMNVRKLLDCNVAICSMSGPVFFKIQWYRYIMAF